MVQDWAHLEENVLLGIAEKLSTINDYVRLRAVCKGWRRAVPPRTCHLPQQAPWLLLPRPATQYANGRCFANDSVLSFYDPYLLRTHSCFELPQCHRATFIRGSSHGWLVLEYDQRLWFYNPINRREIGRLPPLIGLLQKVVLSCNPSREGCVVVASYSPTRIWELCFCRIGDRQWTVLKMTNVGPNILDFTVHNNSVYMLNVRNGITIYDLQNPAVPIRTYTLYIHGAFGVNLVEGGTESGGLYVHRHSDGCVFKWNNDLEEFQIMRNRAIYRCMKQCFDQQLEEEQGSRMNKAVLRLQENLIRIDWMNLENILDGNTIYLQLSNRIIGLPSWFTPSLI